MQSMQAADLGKICGTGNAPHMPDSPHYNASCLLLTQHHKTDVEQVLDCIGPSLANSHAGLMSSKKMDSILSTHQNASVALSSSYVSAGRSAAHLSHTGIDTPRERDADMPYRQAAMHQEIWNLCQALKPEKVAGCWIISRN